MIFFVPDSQFNPINGELNKQQATKTSPSTNESHFPTDKFNYFLVCIPECKLVRRDATYTRSVLVFRILLVQVPVAERSKEYFCCRSPAEILGSNPTRGMDVYLS